MGRTVWPFSRALAIGQLVTARWVTFSERQKSIEATDGNLGAHLAHLAKLVEAGYLKEEAGASR